MTFPLPQIKSRTVLLLSELTSHYIIQLWFQKMPLLETQNCSPRTNGFPAIFSILLTQFEFAWGSYALNQNLETTDRITNRNVMSKGSYAPALSSWPSHFFKNLNLWETVNIMHPGSFSTLIQLKPQTVSRVHSRKLLNSSHSSSAQGHGRSLQTNLPSVHNFVRSYYCENSICDCVCCGCRNSCWVSALHHQK